MGGMSCHVILHPHPNGTLILARCIPDACTLAHYNLILTHTHNTEEGGGGTRLLDKLKRTLTRRENDEPDFSSYVTFGQPLEDCPVSHENKVGLWIQRVLPPLRWLIELWLTSNEVRWPQVASQDMPPLQLLISLSAPWFHFLLQFMAFLVLVCPVFNAIECHL